MTDKEPFWINAEHAYRAPEGNYFANMYQLEGYRISCATWADFLEEMGSADDDYNYLYRWDYQAEDPSDYEVELEEDEYFEIPEPVLKFCYVLQGKGSFLWVELQSPKASDEEAIRSYLQDKWKHIQAAWAPISE